MDEVNKTEKETKEKTVEKVKVKIIDNITVSHSGKLYKQGDIIEMAKPESERLAKICKIEEVKK